MELIRTELYGESRTRKDLSDFTMSERFYEPYFRTPEHAHDKALFCLVLDGSYTETYGSQHRECSRATALFHVSGDPHAEYFHSFGGHSFIVEIENNWMDMVREQILFPNISSDFNYGVLPKLGAKLYREFLTRDAFSPLVIEGLMLEIVGETGRQVSSRSMLTVPAWIKKAENYLRERCSEPFSLQEVADHVGVHSVHLAKTFRKFHQTTVGSYLRKIRLEHARNQIINTQKPLAEISFEFGFSDQSHFSRLFKSEFGLSPRQFRKNHR